MTSLYLLLAQGTLHESKGDSRTIPSFLDYRTHTDEMEDVTAIELHTRRRPETIRETNHAQIIRVLTRSCKIEIR